MLAVILEFDVIEGKEQEFIASWTECTRVIYEHFGSLGSRLHKSDSNLYIAYAQWPNAEVYEKSGDWPEHLVSYRDKMRATLKTGKPKLRYRLQLNVDLLKNEPFQDK